MKNITGENINMLPNYHSVSIGFIKSSGYWRNWVGPIKRLRMEPLPFQLVHKAQCIFLCVVLDLVRASFTLSRYCTIVQVHLLPPWALGKPFTTLSNLWASFTSLHMATVCNLEAKELLPPPVGALLLRPRTFLVLGPSWGPTTNLYNPSTTHLSMHCIIFSFCVRANVIKFSWFTHISRKKMLSQFTYFFRQFFYLKSKLCQLFRV